MDPVTGFGLTRSPTTLQVNQPFFITVNLPYSIKRGEVVSFQIVLFNYMDNDVVADVTLHNEDYDFEFVDLADSIGQKETIGK